ncbi:GNAT family N-acetyltransferase [Patescibacteria group bacterium]
MKYSKIKNKEELELLKGRRAQCENLIFSFSDEYLQVLKDLLDEKNAFQMFVRDNGDFAGYIAASEKTSRQNFLWIVELFVDSKYQGQGIGSALLGHMIQEAKNKNLDGIITQTEFENTPAQNFYKKVGFVEINNPEWKDGITYELIF